MGFSAHWRLASLAPVCLVIACNAFDSLDTPTNDDQILSAARACFDEGDLECARGWYQKLSSSESDVRASEEAFLTLDQSGAGMSVFIGAVGEGSNGGGSLTALANRLSSGAGEARRLAIYTAYKRVAEINNAELRGFVRFVTGFALAASVLAEVTGANGSLEKSDLVQTPSACANLATCAADCTATTGTTLAAGATLDLVNAPTSQTLSGTHHLGMIDGAIDAVFYALVSELAASGKYSTGLGSFADVLRLADPNQNECYRYVLINNGVGS